MIPLNDFKRQWKDTGSEVLDAVRSVGESGWYILGERVAKFERSLAAWWGIPHAVGVASGLDAIEISLRALGCRPGDHVLTSPISAFATPLAIIKAGAIPVFADCDSGGLIDLDACRKILQDRPDIRFFVPVHLYGHSLDLDELRSLRDDFDLRIVEDCAQSIGAKHRGTPTGCVGQFAATSFYPTKNLGALGDGGAVLTQTEEGADTIRRLRDYGQSSKYRHDIIGYNSRLDEIQAAILDAVYLPRLAGWTESRRRVAGAYLNGISGPSLTVPKPPAESESCWHLFPVLVDAARKSEAVQWLRDRGVGVGEHYPLPLIDQNALAPFRDCIPFDCPRSREFCSRELSLPIHAYMAATDSAAVIEACNAWR